MCVCARLLLLAALPALAGVSGWGARGDVVSVRGAGGAGGAGPAFAPRQRTAAAAPLGGDVTLDCRVLRLGDKAVSWVRSRDLQILAHGGAVFTADARVSTAPPGGPATGASTGSGTSTSTGSGTGASTGSRHSLHIARLRAADAGRYECQLNTEPKMSLFFNLTVVDEAMPAVVVVAAEGEVWAVEGGGATLACSARYEPAPRALPVAPLDVRWLLDGAPVARRGAVALDTERWAARVQSRLTLSDVRAADAGLYRCAAGERAQHVRLHVTRAEEQMEMQRDESVHSGAALSPVTSLVTSLAALLAAPLLAALARSA